MLRVNQFGLEDLDIALLLTETLERKIWLT